MPQPTLFHRGAKIAISAPVSMAEAQMGIPDPVHDSQFYEGVPPRRFIAFCIDVLFIAMVWLVVLVLGVVITVLTFGAAAPLIALGMMTADFLYRWFMLSQRSATLGMMLTGVEIRGPDGHRLSPFFALLHVGGFYVTLAITPLLIISWILMASSPHHRLMHDIFLGTVVINRPA